MAQMQAVVNPFHGLALKDPSMTDDQIPDVAIGPLMSRHIFAAKWKDKFYVLITRQCDAADPFVMCRLAIEGFHHIMNFLDQAHQHSFTAADFPPPTHPPGQFTPEVLKSLKKWMGNPFKTMQQVTLATDVKLQRFKAIKIQGDAFCGLRWKMLPEEIRRQLNDIFVELDVLEKAGLWQVSEEDRKKVAQTLKESEKEFNLMTGPY